MIGSTDMHGNPFDRMSRHQDTPRLRKVWIAARATAAWPGRAFFSEPSTNTVQDIRIRWKSCGRPRFEPIPVVYVISGHRTSSQIISKT
jgi:hypothetical protein